MQQFNGLKASPLFLLIKCQITLTANELTPPSPLLKKENKISVQQ